MAAPSTLSVVLPVHNAQQTLAGRITTLLDILPELTPHFEIVVIDDGSVDHTIEIAHELARMYPQIQVAQHDQRRGSTAIVATALAVASSEILFIQDDDAAIDTTKFHRLWSLRGDERVAQLPPPLSDRPAIMQRLAAWGVRLEGGNRNGQPGGLQMLRRTTPGRGRHSAATTPAQTARRTLPGRVDSRAPAPRIRAHEYMEVEDLLPTPGSSAVFLS